METKYRTIYAISIPTGASLEWLHIMTTKAMSLNMSSVMTYSTTDFFTCEFLFATDMINLHDNIMLFKSSSALDDIMEPDGEVMIRFIDEELLIFGRFAEDGECHFVVDRLDGPAIVIDENNYAWISNDDKHRTDGPAVMISDLREEWWQDGVFHREDGPAMIQYDGDGKILFEEWIMSGLALSDAAIAAIKKRISRKQIIDEILKQ